jgi:hypothetical protein
VEEIVAEFQDREHFLPYGQYQAVKPTTQVPLEDQSEWLLAQRCD